MRILPSYRKYSVPLTEFFIKKKKKNGGVVNVILYFYISGRSSFVFCEIVNVAAFVHTIVFFSENALLPAYNVLI